MKKIITLLLIFVMCFSLSVSANQPSLDFIKKSCSNYTAHVEMQLELDEPLKILDVLEEQGFFEDFENHIDIKSIINSFFNSNTKCDIQMDLSEDFKKIRCAINMENNTDIDFNKNLNIGTVSNMGVWLDMDFTDSNAPKLDYIISHPMYNKYLYFTYEDIVELLPDFNTIFSLLLDSGILQQIYDNSYKMILDYADVSIKNGKCIIKMSDEAFDKYLLYVLGMMEGFGFPNIDSEAVAAELAKFSIIAEEGINQTFTYNTATKKIKSDKQVIPFDINVYEILSIYAPEAIPKWLTEKNSVINFSIVGISTYTNVGTTKNIVFPELTEENSISFIDEMVPTVEPEYEEEYYEPENEFNFWMDIYTDKYVYQNDTFYIPFRAAIENVAYSPEQYNISYENGNITFSSPCVDFETLSFSVGDNTYYKDGIGFDLAAPTWVDGSVWVDIRLFSDVFGWELSNLQWDYILNELYVSFFTM